MAQGETKESPQIMGKGTPENGYMLAVEGRRPTLGPQRAAGLTFLEENQQNSWYVRMPWEEIQTSGQEYGVELQQQIRSLIWII